MKKQTRTLYEKAFSELVGAVGARAFLLGRQALVILLKVLGVQPGDRIGICSFTCLSVLEAIKVCGAIPIYLDVDEHLSIDPKEIIKRQKGVFKVVVLQHTFGVPGHLEELLSACKKKEAYVVEDCAHALGCFWKGTHLGSFGEGAIYSFQFGKPYTTGQGGMLTINSTALLDKVDEQISKFASPMSVKDDFILGCKRQLFYQIMGTRYENFAISFSAERHEKAAVKKILNPEHDFSFCPDYIKLAGNRMSAAGLKQLQNWPKFQQLRRRNTEMLTEQFSKAGFPLWPIPSQADVTMLRYPLLTPNKFQTIELARKSRIDLAGWYASPVHPLRNEELAKVDYQIGSCPRAEQMISKLVHIPTGTALRADVLEMFIELLKKGYYGR